MVLCLQAKGYAGLLEGLEALIAGSGRSTMLQSLAEASRVSLGLLETFIIADKRSLKG